MGGSRVPQLCDLGFKGNMPSAEQFSANLRERLTRAKACLEAAQHAKAKQLTETRGQKENGRGFSIGSGNVAPSVRRTLRSRLQVPWNAQVVAPLDRSLVHARKDSGTCGGQVAFTDRQRCAYIHPVFHVSLLRQYKRDGQTPPSPDFNDDYWMVDNIVDGRDGLLRGAVCTASPSSARPARLAQLAQPSEDGTRVLPTGFLGSYLCFRTALASFAVLHSVYEGSVTRWTERVYMTGPNARSRIRTQKRRPMYYRH